MISVVAPNLNGEKYLPTFLDSLLNQTFKDFEVIIVDGNSTDNSYDIIDAYANFLNVFLVVDETRNFGYIRNLGAKYADGTIMLHCNSDNYLEPQLLEKLHRFYREHPETLSVSGRVFPLGTNIFAHLSYQLFDFLRFIFTCVPMPIKKYRPSGNFMSMRSWLWKQVGGYPEVSVNEDGLMGGKIEEFMRKHKLGYKTVAFNLNFYVGHHVKRFEQKGGVRTILFYFYTLANLFPVLKPLLKPIEEKARLTFQGVEPKPRRRIRTLLRDFWDWL